MEMLVVHTPTALAWSMAMRSSGRLRLAAWVSSSTPSSTSSEPKREPRPEKLKEKWDRGLRAPRAEDDNGAFIAERLAANRPEWEAYDIVPGERLPDGNKASEPIRYGMTAWRALFCPRQLPCHGTSVEVYRELLETDRASGSLTDLRKAAYVYLAPSLDKMLNYNSRMSVWMLTREVVANTFNRHDFAFCWSHCEMAPLIVGLGYDGAVEQTAKCIEELVALVRPDGASGGLAIKIKRVLIEKHPYYPSRFSNAIALVQQRQKRLDSRIPPEYNPQLNRFSGRRDRHA